MMSFIVAMDKNRVIGKDNQLPWHLPSDLAYFKKITSKNTIIMGRKTFESIGRPLPKRRNIILTRNQDFQAEGCEVIHDTQAVVELCKQENECFVIGGSELFSLFFEDVDRLYITYINEEFPGDTYFPEMKESEWQLLSAEQGTVDEKNHYRHEFRVYERITSLK
ncbi:dihydrofolate reductase [Halalkalibacter nanhaiisediminis]|uniref:Dihydrofolate reductase n=1 Tax=Halalkalibacter nanhaiisediminis TaxID=688079 RepID=A0A562QV25_9BACI|nr:dihydrofolate reductase [Halalkalibacter nanhaiisediminis]TWI60090.1 dihydrofolate reductase [Halalkalibacter nanhaiisediminis]